MTKLSFAIGLVVLAACGSSGSSSPADDGGAGPDGGDVSGDAGGGDGTVSADGGGTDGASGEAGCGASVCAPGACGATTDACGQQVTCGMCTYAKEAVAKSAQSLSLVTRGTLAVAYAGGGTINLATKASSWASEQAATAGEDVDLAIAPDGTPWISIRDTTKVSVAHRSAGAWTVDAITGSFERAAIAVTSDGTPYLAVTGSSGGMNGVLAFRYASDAWTPEAVVATTELLQSLDVVAAGAVPYVAWTTFKGAVHVSHKDGATFTDETVANDGYIQVIEGIGIDVDSAGTIHIAYANSGHGATHAVRGASGWQSEAVGGSLGSMDALRFAAGPNGKLAVAWASTRWITVATTAGGKWFSQVIVPGCEDVALDIGYDAAGALNVVHACTGAPTLLVQSGAYPAGYAQACADLAKALCQKGLACSPDAGNGACCIVRKNGSSCPNPEWYCEVEANNDICGDATLDPSAASACAQAIPLATCATTQPGVALPDACPFAD